METIIVHTRGKRFLYSALYSALGGLLFVLPFFLLYSGEEYLTWIFIAEVLILIGLYNFKRSSADILGDLLYIRFDAKTSQCRISRNLKNRIEEDALLGKMVELQNETSKRLNTILKEVAFDKHPNLEAYNGGIVSFDKIIFKIHLLKESHGKIVCIFQDISLEMKKYNELHRSYIEKANLSSLQSSILRYIPVPIVVRNNSMEIIYYNDPYYELAIGPDAPFDKSKLEINKEYTQSAMDSYTKDEEIVTERSIVLEGEKELFQITDIPDRDAELVISIILSMKEIGKLKSIVGGLRKGMNSFLDSLDYACMVISKDGNLKYFNTKLREIWGIESEFLDENTTHTEILDHLYLKGKLPAQSDYTKFKHERVALHERLNDAKEDFFYLPDGKCIRSSAVPFEAGSVLFTYEDITSRLDVERDLKFASKVRDSIITHSKEGVCVFDKEGNLDVVNDNMLRIWQLFEESKKSKLTSDAFIEKSFVGLGEAERAKVENAFHKALVSNIEVEQVIKGLNDKIIQRRISPLPNKGVMISDQEITEDFKKMESYLCEIKTLKAIDKDKSTYLANMPHKMRGAVNALIGVSHILLTQNVANLTKEQGKYLKDLKSSADYVAKILDESSDLSEFKNLYDIPVIKEIDLAQQIKKSMKVLDEDFKIKNIKVKFSKKTDDTNCVTDGDRLESALISILQNCIYRSKPDGNITLDLTSQRQKFILKITDNGVPLSLQKFSNMGSNYYSLSITYARMMLESLNLELKSHYSATEEKSIFVIEFANDRNFNQFD